MTVDTILVKMAQLNSRKAVLDRMRKQGHMRPFYRKMMFCPENGTCRLITMKYHLKKLPFISIIYRF